MKVYLFLLAIILSFTRASYSQYVAKSQVIDSETRKPVPYVNIGILKMMQGTVSNEQGEFMLKYSSEDNVITFSAIGYENYKITVHDLLKDDTVHLTPTMYEMEEIVVQEKALGKLKNIGYNLKKRGESVGFGSTQLGTEIGGLIEIDRETVIYQAFFTVNSTSGDSLLFRVNIYEFENGEPTKNLLPENVLVNTPSEAGTFSVNLTKYNIVTEKDVLLSLEWIKAVSTEQDEIQGITFRADKTRRNPNMYMKSTSLAPFRKMDEFVKYHLGFYLSARQVTQ